MKRRHHRYLVDEPPLIVAPRLATLIGLEEAIVLQQVHYWLDPDRSGGREHEGRKWVYNTYTGWQQQFPFWTERIVRRVFQGLEKSGLLMTTTTLNTDPRDRTKWYTIDYDHPILAEKVEGGVRIGSDETRACNVPNSALASDEIRRLQGTENGACIYKESETTPETTTDISLPRSRKKPVYVQYPEDFSAFWKAYPKGHGTKKLAYAEWEKLSPDEVMVGEIMAGLEEWKRSERWRDGFVRDAERFLKHRMWEDAAPPPKPHAVTTRGSRERSWRDEFLLDDDEERDHDGNGIVDADFRVGNQGS